MSQQFNRRGTVGHDLTYLHRYSLQVEAWPSLAEVARASAANRTDVALPSLGLPESTSVTITACVQMDDESGHSGGRTISSRQVSSARTSSWSMPAPATAPSLRRRPSNKRGTLNRRVEKQSGAPEYAVEETTSRARSFRVLQSRLSVGSAAALAVGGSVALEASPLRLGIPHHDQELSETTTDFIHAVRLE